MVGAVKPMTIEREYEKNPDISLDDVRKLRHWLQTQPHLPEKFLTDVDLLVVFHCCERSMEVSKQVLDLHFTLRTLFTGFFKDRAFDRKAEFALSTVLCAPLPTPTAEGFRVVYLRLLDTDPRNFNLLDVTRAFMMVFDLWQYEEGTWPGFVMLIDMDQSVLGHITRLDIMVLKKVICFLQECMFTKLKGIHFLNAPPFMDKLLFLLKQFFKKELQEMLHVHQVGSDTIEKYVSRKSFPKEEGENTKIILLSEVHNIYELFQRLRANSEFIKNENARRVSEALKAGGTPAAVIEEFGIQGSFKTLAID